MEKIYIGIDWSESKHDVCLLNGEGVILAEFIIEQSQKGYEKLAQSIAEVQAQTSRCFVAIETAHNALIEFLQEKGYCLFVLPPNLVASSRGRFGSSGRRNDRSDAHLIADICRTDQQRLLPWQRESRQITQIRALLHVIDDLTQTITQYSNRLRAILLRSYPLAQGLFGDLTTQLALHFLLAYPTQAQAQALTLVEFTTFCQQHHYSRPVLIPRWWQYLQRDVPVPEATTQLAHQELVLLLAGCLLMLVQQKRQAIGRLQKLFLAHPDQTIFASIPGAGELLAPKLLALFGDQRSLFPAPAAVQALAGTCPITIQSGKKKTVLFRRGCNHEFRHTAHLLAVASISQSTWAAAYFAQARQRGLAKAHAYRCLANRWLAIIWTLWQRHQTYDEAYHLKQVQRPKQATTA
jgi:transposase